MNGGESLVETLLEHGVDTVFTVPGESFLTVLEAMRRRQNAVRLVTSRQEGGAAFAAEAYGKLTGRPAAVFVSRGPGATNAAIGVHTAKQDSTPLLLFMGQVRRRSRGRESFQEIDPHSTFDSLAKAVLEPENADEVASLTARAIEIATSGRPGPVVVALPRDVTEAEVVEAVPFTPASPPPAAPEAEAVARAAELIAAAQHPLILAGEAIVFEDCTAALTTFAEASGAPVMTVYRRQDVFANDHPAYAGHLEINRVAYQREALEAADLIIAAGSRLDGITVEDYTLFRDDQALLHLYPDAEVLSRYESALAIEAPVGTALAALVASLPAPPAGRLAWRDTLHRAYLAHSDPGASPTRGRVDLARVVAEVARQVPADAVILTDGGSFARWVHRYYRFTRPHTQAGPISGAMGYGVPGAIGARLARPDQPAVVFVGDGGFMMTGQELVTAVEQGIAVKVIVCDNNAHGSILMGQTQRFGDDAAYGTRLASPDFAAIAQAYGLESWRVEETDGFAPAFAEALAHEGPALVHLLTDERDIVPFGAGKEAV
jgi:acetolactate synthase-1/2/3 large subunit